MGSRATRADKLLVLVRELARTGTVREAENSQLVRCGGHLWQADVALGREWKLSCPPEDRFPCTELYAGTCVCLIHVSHYAIFAKWNRLATVWRRQG